MHSRTFSLNKGYCKTKHIFLLLILCLFAPMPANALAFESAKEQTVNTDQERLKVVLTIDQMAVTEITTEDEIPIIGSNTVDEVYFFVTGTSSRGLFARRLPTQDDYYQFWNGSTSLSSDYRTWTNLDEEPIGRPFLWAGELANQEGADLFVVVAEQDNKKLGALKRALQAGHKLMKATYGTDPKAAAALQFSEPLIEAIPEIDKDDIIGAFVVHLENVGGQVSATFVPWLEYQFESGREGGTTVANSESYAVKSIGQQGSEAIELDLMATRKGHYRAIVKAAVVEEFGDAQFEFLGVDIDRCGEELLYVKDRVKGIIEITEGQSDVPIDILNHRFYWYCGADSLADDDKDWTTAPLPTDRIYVTRGASRKITWKSYRDTFKLIPDFVVRGLALSSSSDSLPLVLSSQSPTEVASADIHIKSVTPSSTTSDTEIINTTLVIVIGNQNDDTARNVSLRLSLPPIAKITAANQQYVLSPLFNESPGYVLFALGDIDPGSEHSLEVSLQFSALQDAYNQVGVFVSSDLPDPNAGNNFQHVVVEVTP